MIWLLVVVLLLAIMPLVLATAGVSMLAWAVTYFAVLAGLAVGLRHQHACSAETPAIAVERARPVPCPAPPYEGLGPRAKSPTPRRAVVTGFPLQGNGPEASSARCG